MRTLILTTVMLLGLLGRTLADEPLRQIKGVVTDAADGSPLVGATIFINPDQTQAKDFSPQGTITDQDGRFIFSLPQSVGSVIASYIGYDNQTIDIANISELKIALSASQNIVDAVVVTGYQKIEKRKLTSSIATIKADDIQQAGVATIDQMLSGQIAGVTSTPTSGAPGAANRMKIRSTVTLNGTTDPLWVLDGIPLEGNEIPKDWNSKENIDNLYNMSIAGLNPADIESITFLKDAASTAIYGARAANGVIVVTTKRGFKSQPIKVNASLNLFVNSQPNLDKLNLLNASEKVDLELALAGNPRLDYMKGYGGVGRLLDQYGQRQTYINGGFGALSPELQGKINSLRNNGTNWADEIYRMTINQQYSLNVSGGGERSSYYFSTGYFNEQGSTRGTGFERFNITLKGDYELRKNLKFGTSLFASQNKNKSYMTDANAFINPANYTRNVNPYLSAYDENGKYVYDPDMLASKSGSEATTLPFNYFEEMEGTNYELKSRSLKAIFDLEYKPITGLRLYTQLGLQVDNNSTEKSARANTYYTRKYALDATIVEKDSNGNPIRVGYLPEGGVIQNWNSDMMQYTWKAQAEYSRRFGDKHEMDLMGGLEMRGSESKNIHTKGFGYDHKTLVTKPLIDLPESLANDKRFQQYQNTFYENRYLSYFATGSYTYDNRYTFFGSIRYDGTNLFGVDPKYKFNPMWSVSGAWNIKEEQFLRDVNWISNLRLRGSYGVQGNVDRTTSPYILGTWNTTNLGGTTEDRINVTSPPNQNLRWESTYSWNAAVDAGFIDNRINLTAEIYGRKSKDLITTKSIPQETGFITTSTNFGIINSRGVELSLNTVNVKTKNFRWESQFNIAHNTDKVIRTNMAPNQFTPSLEGYSSNAIFGLPMAGLDNNGVPMFWRNGERVSAKDFFGFAVDEWGMANFNTSADDVRNSLVYIGSRDPKFTGGFNNKFSYKNFDLAVSANFVFKQNVTTQPFYQSSTMNPGQNYTRALSQVWSPSNPNGIYPVISGSQQADGSSWGSASSWDDVKIWNYLDQYGYGNSSIFNSLDIWTKEISYFRINSIRLGYTFPQQMLKKVGIASARLNFEVRNPFVISSDYTGYFDPENYGNIYAQPLARTFSIGLNIGF